MQNFFKIFDLEEQFEIDLELLDERYFALLSATHPDVTKQNTDIQDTMRINYAYNILKDDLERATHLLELHGFFIKDDTKAPKLSAEILEYIIELHEKPVHELEKNLSELKLSVAQFLGSQNYAEAAVTMLEIRYINRIYEHKKA